MSELTEIKIDYISNETLEFSFNLGTSGKISFHKYIACDKAVMQITVECSEKYEKYTREWECETSRCSATYIRCEILNTVNFFMYQLWNTNINELSEYKIMRVWAGTAAYDTVYKIINYNNQ